MAVTIKVKNINALAERLAAGAARPYISVRVIVSGPAAAYAMIWEWGRITCQPGPKTLWSTNPLGEERVMTVTAPFGFIWMNRREFRKCIHQEMAKIHFNHIKPSDWPNRIQKAFDDAGVACADIIADDAPMDTGALRAAIRAESGSGPSDSLTQVTRTGLSSGPAGL